MLKTRITKQYGVEVPFINAGMAFIATAPLVRAVCNAGGMGMLGIPAMPPDVLQAAIRDVKAVDPACFGVDIIARFSGIEHIEVCVTEKVPVVVFFSDDAPDEWLSRLRAAGIHIWFQVGSVEEAKAALRHGAQGSSCKAARLAATTAPPRQRSHCSRQSSMQSLPCPSSLRVALPMVGPLLLRWRSVPTQSGWGLAYSASFEANAHPHYKDRVVAVGVEDTARDLIFGPRIPRCFNSAGCATASCGNGNGVTIRRHTRSFRIRSFR